MKILSYLGISVLVFIGISFIVEVTETSPDHAIVLLSHSKKQYTSPPCIEYGISDFNEFYDIATEAEAHNLDYSPDKNCVNYRFGDDGGFTHSKYLFTVILEYFGLFPENSRWNDKGGWNY